MSTDQVQSEEQEIELPPVEFTAHGDSEATRWANLERVKPTEGFTTLSFLFADALTHWAQTVLINITSKDTGVNFQVDGQWRKAEGMDRKSGDHLSVVIKQLAGLDFRKRHGVQEGVFHTRFYNLKFECQVTCVGTQTGEQIVIKITIPRPTPATFVQMGMREKQLAEVKAMFKNTSGLIVSSCLEGDGESTMWQGIKGSGDRFTKDYFAVEKKGTKEPDVENVGSQYYTDEPGDYDRVVRDLILREPAALFLGQCNDPKRIMDLVNEGKQEDFLVIIQVHARSAAETPLRLLSLGLDPEFIAENLIGVVTSRLVRRLCDGCKQGFTPPDGMLRQLSIPKKPDMLFYDQFDPQGYAESVWDGKGELTLPPPCPVCSGAGFYGRTGVFEILTMNEQMKQVVSSQGNLTAMKKAVASLGGTTFKEEGLLKVVQGITSLDELQRILKL